MALFYKKIYIERLQGRFNSMYVRLLQKEETARRRVNNTVQTLTHQGIEKEKNIFF